MYSIKVNPPSDLIEVTLGEMMTPPEVQAYIKELKQALVTYKLQGYSMVIDVSRCPIQSQDMVNAMRDHMASMPKARALAVVVGGSLARMQVRRLFHQSYARIVGTVEDGRRWTLAGIEPPRDPIQA